MIRLPHCHLNLHPGEWLPLVKTKSGAARLFCPIITSPDWLANRYPRHSALRSASANKPERENTPTCRSTPNDPTVTVISGMAAKQKKVRDRANEKANRDAKQKAWEEASRNVSGKTDHSGRCITCGSWPDNP